MSTYQTEEEQVEAIKNWWKENGKSVIGGAVLGLALVGGFKGWTEYNRIQAEGASASYEGFTQLARSGDAQAALARGEQLIAEHDSSTYAMFTALEMAKLEYQAGNPDKARGKLEWVIRNAGEEAIKQLAQLRLARLLMDGGELEEAEKLAQTVTGGNFAPAFDVVRGDIAFSRGDMEAARAAYEQALAQGINDQNLVRIKLAEAGG